MSETAVEINDRIKNMYRNRMKMDFLSSTVNEAKKNITSNGQCLFANNKNGAALNSKLKNLPQYSYNQTDSFERPQCKETYRGNDEEVTPFCKTPFGQTICDAVRELQRLNTLSNITSNTTANITEALAPESSGLASSTPASSPTANSTADETPTGMKNPRKNTPNQGARQLTNVGNSTKTNPEANSSSSKITSILFIYAIYTFL